MELDVGMAVEVVAAPVEVGIAVEVVGIAVDVVSVLFDVGIAVDVVGVPVEVGIAVDVGMVPVDVGIAVEVPGSAVVLLVVGGALVEGFLCFRRHFPKNFVCEEGFESLESILSLNLPNFSISILFICKAICLSNSLFGGLSLFFKGIGSSMLTKLGFSLTSFCRKEESSNSVSSELIPDRERSDRKAVENTH